MLSKWQDISSILSSEQINLSEAKSAMLFVTTGFSLSSSFKVVTKQGVRALSKSDLSSLKAVITNVVSGNKNKLRALIPVFLPILVASSLGESSTVIKTYLQSVLSRVMDPSDLQETRALLEGALQRPFYARSLNSELDPIASMFNGKAPNSFSNAVTELLNNLPEVQSTTTGTRPVLVPVGPSQKQPKPTLRRVDSPKQTAPSVETDTATQTAPSVETPTEQQPLEKVKDDVSAEPTRAVNKLIVAGSFLLNLGLYIYAKSSRVE